MEYCDRRGQYGWDTLSYGDLVRRHAEYYKMDMEREKGFYSKVLSGEIKPMGMGSKRAPSAFKMKMDVYLDEHGEEDGIMAPCGCMLTKKWTAQGREMDESPKEEGGLGGHGAAPVGRGGRPGRGESEGKGVQGKHGGGKASGTKSPDWDSPAEGTKAGKEDGKKYGKEEEDQDEY
jgi:hypothetical protein